MLCLQKLQQTWPELWSLRLDGIMPEACKEWAAQLSKEIAVYYYNNTIGSLKLVLAVGLKAHAVNCETALESPAKDVRRTRIKGLGQKGFAI